MIKYNEKDLIECKEIGFKNGYIEALKDLSGFTMLVAIIIIISIIIL